MSKKAAVKRKPTVQRQSPADVAKAERRQLRQRIALEKEIYWLANQLERRIRQADYRLLHLGTALMARAARVNQAEAARDVQRENAIHDRQPVAAD